MKQIIIYVVLFILALVGVVIIRLNEKPVQDKAITIEQYYSVADVFQGLDVALYLSNDDHLLSDIEAYQMVYLKNEDESKKFQVSLTAISIDGEETYLNEVFTRYMLEFSLPVLNDDYWIDDCYLDISLKNDLHYVFDIGSFSYLSVEDDVDHMFWTSLEAKKALDVDISRIGLIAVRFDALEQSIERVSIGLNQEVTYELSDGLLTVNIAYQHQLLHGCPILIHYQDKSTQVIQYVNYLKENAVLTYAGLLNHVYDVNQSK